MIVCALGYGYLSRFIFQRICLLGVKGIGVTSKEIKKNAYTNITLVNREQVIEVLDYATHLLITAPPDNEGCPIFNKFSKKILCSNVKSLIYVSTTGVYGNHNGRWVDESSALNAKSYFDKIRINSEKQWTVFCRKHNLNLNIVRISGIYGPNRVMKMTNKKLEIVIKKNHYFSRIHILDAARLVSKIIFENRKNEVWNLADNYPSTREAFLKEAIKIKKIKKFSTIAFEEYYKTLSERSKKFWTNNKKVSNDKIKKYFKYSFIFSDYRNGIRNLKEYF